MSVDRLAVLLEGRHIADVVRGRRGLRLNYLSEARRPGQTPLSLSLPPILGQFEGRAVSDYLDGVLPNDSRTRAAIGRTYGVDGADALDLLSAIGLDVAGAVQFCTPGAIDEALTRTGRLVPASESDIEGRLAELRLDDEPRWVMPGEHWSLGGSQGKFTLRRESGRWHFPHGAEPSTHIVKPGVRAVQRQALIEHVTMRVAEALGLDVAETSYVDFGSERAIVVTRFDRIAGRGGALVRRHQEDLCQALGNPQPYEAYGGPGVADISALLADQSATAVQARENLSAFAEAVVFQTIVGAPDAHARNVSVMLDGQTVRLAPMYDAASAFAYRSADARVLSMSVGGSFRIGELSADHWRRFAQDARQDEAAVLDRVAEMAALVPDAAVTALEGIDDWNGDVGAVRERLLPTLREMCEYTARSVARH